jgi:hypothetical protein
MLKKNIENEIIALYSSNLVNIFSINQISKLLKKKYPYVNKKVGYLIENNVLNKIEVGKSYLCSLNLNNDKTLFLLSFNEILKKEFFKFNDKTINKEYFENFINNNSINLGILSVFLSKDNIIFIVNDLKYRRKIEDKFSNCIVIDQNELSDLLIEKPDFFENYIVLYGYEKFFELIKHNFENLKKTYSPLKY